MFIGVYSSLLWFVIYIVILGEILIDFMHYFIFFQGCIITEEFTFFYDSFFFDSFFVIHSFVII